MGSFESMHTWLRWPIIFVFFVGRKPRYFDPLLLKCCFSNGREAHSVLWSAVATTKLFLNKIGSLVNMAQQQILKQFCVIWSDVLFHIAHSELSIYVWLYEGRHRQPPYSEDGADASLPTISLILSLTLFLDCDCTTLEPDWSPHYLPNENSRSQRPAWIRLKKYQGLGEITGRKSGASL